MSDEDIFLSPCLNKTCEFPKKDERQTNNPDKLYKNGNEDGDRIWKKRDNSVKRKEFEKINKMHLKRGGSTAVPDKVPTEGQNQQHILQPPPADEPGAEEETDKSKNMKKQHQYDIVPSNRFKTTCAKVREEEKAPDSRAKKSPLKTKAITAFGTTFRKAESEPHQFAKKKAKSSVDRFGKSKRRKSKDALLEECGDEPAKVQSRLEPSEKCFSTQLTLSKNKLSIMSEGGERDREKRKGTSEISINKRANSPKRILSKIDTRKEPSKCRIEDDLKRRDDERAEIEKELSLFEKIQQNLRAYFNPKPVEITKFDSGERKVKEGENPDNDENIMIWNDERIERGIKEDFMKGDQSFFMGSESEKEIVLEKISFKRNRGNGEVTNGYLPGKISRARGIGSGPEGKICYYCGDKYPYNHNYDHYYKSVFYIKRSNEFKEKPRKRSFHRSKTLQKNALAPSPPKASTSIGFILEPAQQVENLYSADGMVSAITQIQELHQEIKPRVLSASVSCARGFATTNLREDTLTHLPNYLPGDSVRAPMKPHHSLMRTPSRSFRCERINFRTKRHETHHVYSRKSTADIFFPYSTFPNASKSEGTFHSDFPVPPSSLPGKEIRIFPFRDNTCHPTSKQGKPFVRFNNPLFVYTLTEIKSIRSPNRKWLDRSPSREQEMTRRGEVESGGKEESEKGKRIPIKYSVATRKIEDESPSVTLKDIIGLSRKTLAGGADPGPDTAGCSGTAVGDPARPGRAVTLGHYLEKLMEEKKNYLNLEKTKMFRKTQKVNFVADSFNFFNLLNKKFLAIKSSNPKIEVLRKIIAEKKEPEMEEYLDAYRKVIRTSLTEPEQHLMDQAKQELERYTDMYYDLMRCICLENDGKSGGKYLSNDKNHKTVHRGSVKINPDQVFKSEGKENIKSSLLRDNYFETTSSTRPEKSYCLNKIKESKKNYESGTGKKCNGHEHSASGRTEFDDCLNDGKIPVIETQPVSELLNNNKIGTDRERKSENEPERNPSSKGKLLLTISVCEDGLIIKQVNDTAREELHERDKTQLPSTLGEELLSHPSRTDPRTSPSERPRVWEKPSGCLAKADSDETLYPKSSIDEEDPVENPMEDHKLKLKAFRKLLNNGLQYFDSFNDTDPFPGRDCPKVRKRGNIPEARKSQPVPKAVEKEKKKAASDRKTGTEKVSLKEESKQRGPKNNEDDQFSRAIRDERTKPLCQRGHGSCKRSTSPNKREELSKKRPWWHTEQFASVDAATGTSRRLNHTRKSANNFGNGMSLSSKIEDKDGFPRKVGKIRKKMEAKEPEEEKDEKEEDEMSESNSDFKTPPGSYFEWRFGMKNLKDILQNGPTKSLNPDVLSEGKVRCTNEEEEEEEEEEKEQEIIEMDFTGGDGEVEDSSKKVPSFCCESSKNNLKHDVGDPIKTVRERPVNESPHRDRNNIGRILDHFMEKISEAWKTAACLKDLMEPGETRRPGSPEPKEPDDPQAIVNFERDENEGSQQSDKDKIIESFRNFLRILTTVFEDDPTEKVVREKIFIIAKEFLRLFSDLEFPVASEQDDATVKDAGKHFADGISQVPCEIKEMVTKELIYSGVNFTDATNFEPADFAAAMKKIGESLKEIYFPGNPALDGPGSEKSHGVIEYQSPKSKIELKPKKIYYRPVKTCSQNYPEEQGFAKSNMELLTEKIGGITRKEHPSETVTNGKYVLKKNPRLDKQPSVYFDAVENFQHPGESTALMESAGSFSPPAPSSFSKNVNSYAKAHVFDKVIEFLRSDNPASINIGVALLDKIIDEDENFHATNESPKGNDQREEKLYDILDRLTDTSYVIETEMIQRVEEGTRAEPEVSGRNRSNGEKASEHLKIYVQNTKSLAKGIKGPEDDCWSSFERIRALDNSRKTNMERQLIGAPDNRNRLFSDAASFTDTVHNNGCYSYLFPDQVSREIASESTNFDNKYTESILESNKLIVKNLRQNIEKRQRKIMALVDKVVGKKGTIEENLYQEKITKKVRDLKKCYLLLVKLICDPTLSPPKWLKFVESGSTESNCHRKSSAMTLLEDLVIKAAVEPENNRSPPASRRIESSGSDSKAKEDRNNRNTSSAGSLTLLKINYAPANIECPFQTKTNGGKEKLEKVEQENNVLSHRPKTA